MRKKRAKKRAWMEPIAVRVAFAKAQTTIGVVARELDIPKPSLWHWCRGKRSAPVNEILRLAEHLGVDDYRELLEPEQLELL